MGIKRTSIKELKELFKALGVDRYRTVMVHSAVFSLGVVEDGLPGLFTSLSETIRPGATLVVPTFTYSFRKKEIFDVNHTPCPKIIGAFSEYVRAMPQAVRSADPLFSMAAVGPDAEGLMKRESKRCFGTGSVYEKLFDSDLLILSLGISYDTGITAFMHLEHLAGIDYRYDQEFYGVSVDTEGNSYEDSAVHFVRNIQKYPNGRRNRIPFGKQMEQEGVAQSLTFGSGIHTSLPGRLFKEYTLDRLNKNPHCMFIKEYQN